MLKVYVCGPYTGNEEENVDEAIFTAEVLSRCYGFAPYIPHLSHYWEMRFPHPYQFWIDLDNQFLPLCDALYRFGGASKGADAEVELATKLNIPVFYDLLDLFVWSR